MARIDMDPGVASSPESMTPEEVAQRLRDMMNVDDALDLLASVAERTGGWTRELNEVGLHLLKPCAPEGQKKWA
jgi:hypothetical protein